MKTVIVSAMLGLFGAAAIAQEPPPVEPAQPSIMAPVEPASPAVETPVEPAPPAVESSAAPAVEASSAPAQPAVQAAPVPASLPELKKSQGQAVADLKKEQEEAIAQLKASMKGKPIPEMRAAVGKQRTTDKIALKTLKDAQKAEIEQFKKDHPEAVKKIKEVKQQEGKVPAAPEKK